MAKRVAKKTEAAPVAEVDVEYAEPEALFSGAVAKYIGMRKYSNVCIVIADGNLTRFAVDADKPVNITITQ